MDKIQFQTNVPEEMQLRFLDGKEYESKFGGMQHLFSTTDDRCFYVSATVGNILNRQFQKLGITAGEPIEICKREVAGASGRKTIEWQVSKVGFAPGEQPDGTFIAPSVQPGASVSAPAPSPAAAANGQQHTNNNGNGSKPPNGNGNGRAPFAHTGTGQFLLEQVNGIIDIYAASVKYATDKYAGIVTPDRVWSILATVVIGNQKGGRP